MAEIKIIDKGWNKILKNFKAAKDIENLTVGIHEKEGKVPHPSNTGLNVATVAIIHEFGGGIVPERSFLRSTMKGNQKKYQAKVKEVAKGFFLAKTTITKELENDLGPQMVKDIKEKINSDIPPKLRPRTVADREALGFDSGPALVRSGTLRDSITAKVKK